MGRDLSTLIRNNRMNNLEYYEILKEKLREDGWIEQKCGEIYFLSSVGTNFYKDREIIHVSLEIDAEQEKVAELKDI